MQAMTYPYVSYILYSSTIAGSLL